MLQLEFTEPEALSEAGKMLRRRWRGVPHGENRINRNGNTAAHVTRPANHMRACESTLQVTDEGRTLPYVGIVRLAENMQERRTQGQGAVSWRVGHGSGSTQQTALRA